MSEVVALANAWAWFRKEVGLAATCHWETEDGRVAYGTKEIFDKGWECAMRYIEKRTELKKENEE